MTQDESKSPVDGGKATPSAGEKLADARHARSISLTEIARELHLDEVKVRALEQNAFEALGAPVFAKGYLRKYAELVGIPSDDILVDYYRLNRATAAPLVVGPRRKAPREFPAGRWAGAGLLLSVAGAAAWLLLSAGPDWLGKGVDAARGLTPATNEPGVSSPRVEPRRTPLDAVERARDGNDSAGGGERDGEDEPGPPGETGAAPALPVVNEAPATPATPVEPRSAAAEGSVELGISFSGDCWTEVTDAAGERLYFGLGSAGRTVTVAGEPPLQVLLGDSENATLAVDGAGYPIPPSARRGDTARLTITGR